MAGRAQTGSFAFRPRFQYYHRHIRIFVNPENSPYPDNTVRDAYTGGFYPDIMIIIGSGSAFKQLIQSRYPCQGLPLTFLPRLQFFDRIPREPVPDGISAKPVQHTVQRFIILFCFVFFE